MSEVEKMYELAGIKPVQNMYHGEDDENWVLLGYFFDICYNALPKNEKVKIKVKPLYPPFTTEKQLELVKWLGKNMNGFYVDYDTSFNGAEKQNHYWCWADQNYGDFNYAYHNKVFNEALAGLVNHLWQSLSDADKAQIKEILE